MKSGLVLSLIDRRSFLLHTEKNMNVGVSVGLFLLLLQAAGTTIPPLSSLILCMFVVVVDVLFFFKNFVSGFCTNVQDSNSWHTWLDNTAAGIKAHCGPARESHFFERMCRLAAAYH
jgi:hypothetical protein